MKAALLHLRSLSVSLKPVVANGPFHLSRRSGVNISCSGRLVGNSEVGPLPMNPNLRFGRDSGAIREASIIACVQGHFYVQRLISHVEAGRTSTPNSQTPTASLPRKRPGAGRNPSTTENRNRLMQTACVMRRKSRLGELSRRGGCQFPRLNCGRLAALA
jgi:hypothetical protein